MDFSFPDVSAPVEEKASTLEKRVPLTAYSTVTHIPSKNEPKSIFSSNDASSRRGRAPVRMMKS